MRGSSIVSNLEIKAVITIEFPRMAKGLALNEGKTIPDLKREMREMFQREVAAPLAAEGATTAIEIEINEV
jgi:uncharacterized protein YqfB (UPF0267 family)